MYLNRTEGFNLGLFGYVSGATIENLNLENCSISGYMNVGGLVGIAEQTTIQNCIVSGVVNGSGNVVGGLVGSNSGSSIIKCQANCTVRGLQYVGGLAGNNSKYSYYSGIIKKCIATGTVRGYFYVGGLVGQNGQALIMESCAKDSVIGTKPGEGYYVRYIGGLVGLNSGSAYIDDSYAWGFVTGDDYIGGLVGYNDGSSIGHCYAVGEVIGSSFVGGLVGSSSWSFVGSFYDSTVAKLNDTGRGAPKSTAEMQTLSTFFNAGWDFEIEDANGTRDVWDMDLSGTFNHGYPFLSWQNDATKMLSLPKGTAPAARDGTAGNPYQIASMENLTWVAVDTNNWDKHFIQTADINAAQTWNGAKWIFIGWMPIGRETKTFTGSYNGNGHSIDSLYISRPANSYQGLFGSISGNTISNLGVTNCFIKGKDYVGALIGSASGTTVQECFSTGNVSGKDYIGGLIGRNSLNTVNNCYSSATATGSAQIGGLIGRHENATLVNSYSTGKVNGSEYFGGLIGRSYIAAADNCFYDTETSGRSPSQGGTGKTTAEMKTQETFTAAGWDFTHIWAMATTYNAGYPYLQWQYIAPKLVTLAINASQIDFGQITIGTSCDTTLTLTNTGNDTLFITQIQSSNQKFTSKFNQMTILPGMIKVDTLWYHPDALGPDSGDIVITSNAASSPDTIKVKGTGVPVVGITNASILNEFVLNQNYPNPFNPTTTIVFALPKETTVNLKIYDLAGREVAVLVSNQLLKAGEHLRVWNAGAMPAGIYFCRLEADGFSAVKKVVLVK